MTIECDIPKHRKREAKTRGNHPWAVMVHSPEWHGLGHYEYARGRYKTEAQARQAMAAIAVKRGDLYSRTGRTAYLTHNGERVE